MGSGANRRALDGDEEEETAGYSEADEMDTDGPEEGEDNEEEDTLTDNEARDKRVDSTNTEPQTQEETEEQDTLTPPDPSPRRQTRSKAERKALARALKKKQSSTTADIIHTLDRASSRLTAAERARGDLMAEVVGTSQELAPGPPARPRALGRRRRRRGRAAAAERAAAGEGREEGEEGDEEGEEESGEEGRSGGSEEGGSPPHTRARTGRTPDGRGGRSADDNEGEEDNADPADRIILGDTKVRKLFSSCGFYTGTVVGQYKDGDKKYKIVWEIDGSESNFTLEEVLKHMWDPVSKKFVNKAKRGMGAKSTSGPATPSEQPQQKKYKMTEARPSAAQVDPIPTSDEESITDVTKIGLSSPPKGGTFPRRRRGGGRRKWSAAEVRNLERGVAELGVGNWAPILARYQFDGRTSVNLKDKWRNLEKARNGTA